VVLDTTGISLNTLDVISVLEEANEGFAEKMLEGVCISGGEPLLYAKHLVSFCKQLKELGYRIKIDTTLNGGDISPLVRYIDGVSFSLKTDKSYFMFLKNNLKVVNFSPLGLKELRVILTKENIDAVRTLYVELLNDPEHFTPGAWKLHIDKAITTDECFGEFTELGPHELDKERKTWPCKDRFNELTF